jgi:uncharacterized membrane protein YhfC
MHRRGANIVLPLPCKRRVRILMKQWVLLMATLLFGVLTGLGLTIPDYKAVRTGRYLFTRYATGEKELCDLSNDPYELQSLHNTASTQLKRRLASRLDALAGCAAQSCRSAEN